MNDAARTTLGAICLLTKGTYPTEKTPPGPYPLVVTAESPRTSDSFQLEGEAVCIPIVSSTGHGHASLKRVHYVQGRFAVANLLVAAQPRVGSPVDARWLWLYLNHHKDNLIVPLMRGTANVSLKPSQLADIPVDLPPLAEQKRVVDLVDALDATTRRGESLVQSADAAYQAVLWEASSSTEARVTLGDACEITVGPAFASAGFTSPSDGTKLLRGINLAPGATKWDESVYWPNDDVRRFSRYALQHRDVVIAMDRAFTMSGELRVARIEHADLPALLVQRVARLRVRSDDVSEGLVYHFLRSQSVGSLLASSQTPGGYVPHLSGQDFARCEIPLLSAEPGERMESVLDAASEVAARSRAVVRASLAARSALVASLLSGAHVVPASYDRFLDPAA